ncbi:MAG TPA: stage III sporulation protein SpoIIIAB [Bacillales bacterium]|nr:stage III sporulation protein SpoIIIAB [Bacillales bacterium]
MTQWLGALCIIAATTSIGFRWAKRYSERPAQLRQMKAALQALEAEIMYGLTPLGEACAHLARQTREPVSGLFAAFADELANGSSDARTAWETALSENWPRTALGRPEREVLKQFGSTLGQHDPLQQQKQIRLALTHLEREEAEARDEQRRNEQMIKSLGLLAGLLLALLLI